MSSIGKCWTAYGSSRIWGAASEALGQISPWPGTEKRQQFDMEVSHLDISTVVLSLEVFWIGPACD